MFEAHKAGDAIVFKGDWVIASAAAIRQSLAEAIADPTITILDLAEAERIDTAGVQLLLSALKTDASARLEVHLSPAVRETLDRLGAAGLIPADRLGMGAE